MATSSDSNNTASFSTMNITTNTKKRLSTNSVMDDIAAEQRINNYRDRFKQTADDDFKALSNLVNKLKELPKAAEDYKNLIEKTDKFLSSANEKVKTQEASFNDALKLTSDRLELVLQLESSIIDYKKEQVKLSSLDPYLKNKEIEALDAQLEHTNNIVKAERELINEAKEAEKVLSSAQTRLDKFSKKITSARKWTMDLANTMNLSDIANIANVGGQADKNKIATAIQHQFGINNSSFESFKNTIVSNIQDTNKAIGKSLFGANDMKSYLDKISQYGITNLEIAKQQASASITATKYLGVSDNTQTQMFRFMKRTNDYTMLDKHNKTIVGLLNAQLGVSKEQLDTMTQTALDTTDKLYAMGYSSDSLEKLQRDTLVMSSALSSVTGNENAGQFWTNFLNQALTSSPSNAPEALAGLYQNLQTARISGASQEDLLNLVLNDKVLQNIMTQIQNGYSPQEASNVYASMGISTDLASFLTDMSGKANDLTNAYRQATASVEGMTDQGVEEFLKQNTNITAAEQMYNWMSNVFAKFPWDTWFNLSNIALGMFIADAGFKAITTSVKGIGVIKDVFKSGGGLSGLFAKFLGKNSAVEKAAATAAAGAKSSSSLLSSLGSSIISPGGVAIGALSLIAIGRAVGKAVSEAQQKNAQNYGQSGTITGESQNILGLDKGSKLSAAQQELAGLAIDRNNSDNLGNAFLTELDFLDTTGTLFEGWGKSREDINKARYNKFLTYIKMQKNLDDTALARYNLAYWLVADNSGVLSDITPYTSADLKQVISSSPEIFTKDSLNTAAEKLYSWHPEWMPVLDKKRQYTESEINWKKYGMGGAGNNFVNRSYYSGYGIGGASYPWPVTAGWPNYPEDFGGGRHTGIDFGIPQGTPIGSAESGTVITSSDGWNGGYGNYTIVKGDSGKYYLYAHMSQRKTNVGDKLNKGNLIGLSGTTGNSTGPHLHFEVRNADYYGSDISPYPYINNGLFNASGTATTLTRGQNSEDTAKVPTKKFAVNASILKNAGGPTLNADDMKVVEAVNNGFSALMRQIDNLSRRQDTQQQILESFSRSQNRDLSLGEVVY